MMIGKRFSPFVLCWLILLAAVSVPVVGLASNERAFWDLWQLHLQNQTAHDKVIAACESFVKANPYDSLIPVAEGFQVWHLLKLERRDEAVALMEKHLQPRTGTLNQAAASLARAWLSRMDYDQVQIALKQYYLKEVGYPATLDAIAQDPRIPPELHPPLKDRWRKPWSYELVGFSRLPGFENQKYSLGCIQLEKDPSLEAALARPYVDQIEYMPTSIETTRSNSKIVVFSKIVKESPEGATSASGAASRPRKIRVGSRVGSLYVAYLGDRIVIVCDRAHWAVFHRPKE